jgi:aldehyde dehydrogenase (NAD+)
LAQAEGGIYVATPGAFELEIPAYCLIVREYGLGNFLQTEDKEKAKRVSRKLNAGIIYVNGIGPDSGTPFGGFKQSGNGREGGVWGLEEYLEVKTVTDW